MKTLLLRLEGPLQSWGTQGKYGIRDTDREPSKSGVLGLVGAALGMRRDDHSLLEQLRALELAVRVDREGAVLRDYHTVGAGTFRGKPHSLWSRDNKKDPALTERFYLMDASFLVALGGDDALVQRIAEAVRAPVWPLFLGRRACPPSSPVFAGLTTDAPEVALRAAPIDRARAPEAVRLVTEATQEGSPRVDVPLSFALYERRHALRYVKSELLDRDQLPEAES
jgi:CRISPR system Cascade subunit CasD